MNIYAVIILFTLGIDIILGIAADLLNLRSAATELPDEFRDVYDRERYRQSQRYLHASTRLGMVGDLFNLAVLLTFWFAGGFAALNNWVMQVADGVVARGVVFIMVLMAARFLLGLPFSIYSTFVIEERFGFNKTTPGTFIMDRVKGVGLSILIGVPLLALILYLLSAAGDAAWLYCWAAVTVFTLVLQFVAPTWIMPLFNKFTPLEEGELRRAIMNFADKVSFPLKGVYVIDGSRRSSKSNAFFTGFGRNKRVALFDTLVEKQTVPQLVAVLAHEIGHYKKHHIIKGLVLSIAHTGVLFFLLDIFLGHPGLYEAFFVEGTPVYAGLVFFGLLYSPVELLLAFVINALSRKHEYEADAFAGRHLQSVVPMIQALKKLCADNLVNLTPHPLYVVLHYSHPPMLARICALREQQRSAE